MKRRVNQGSHSRKPSRHQVVTETETEGASVEETSECPATSDETLPIKQPKDKWASFNTRLFWTLVLIFSFFGILAAGHFYCGLLVMLIMAGSYREIISLKTNQHKENRLPLFFVQRWYWFWVTVFGTLYNYIIPLMKIVVNEPPTWMYWVAVNHTLVTYMLCLLGVMMFIFSLRRFSIKYQFTQFCILVLSCLAVVSQGATWVRSISEGLVWFIVPSTAVIANDISAYLCGKKWGRTKLIPRISPNKTVEGFVGASVITFVWALLTMELLAHFKVAICPEQNLTIRPFAMWTDLDCSTPKAFVWTTAAIPTWLQHLGLPSEIPYRSAWIHSMVLSTFASFCAPFGGFLASALKRALKVKDFGDYIPGHGGVTDRFDCQLLMGTFTFLYLRTFVMAKKGIPMIGTILKMTQFERVEYFAALAAELSGTLPSTSFAEITNAFCHPHSPSAMGSFYTDG